MLSTTAPTEIAIDVTPTTLLDAALGYARCGWAVFPLIPGTKEPRTTHGFKNATTDEARIRAWWTDYPTANIGIATGAVSGITVLDVDIKPWKDKRGDKTLAALTAEYGALPLTPKQKTWSGGEQYVFADPIGIATYHGQPGTALDSLDIKSNGGYVVVPPSVVVEGERHGTYVWKLAPDDTPLAPLPSWLVDVVDAVRGARGRRKTTADNGSGAGAAANLRNGQMRNVSLASLAGAMRRKGMSEDAIYAALSTENAQSADPLPDDEVERVAHSIAKYEPAQALTIKVGADGELAEDEKPLSEGGNAERMLRLYPDRFRWVAEEKTWLAWDDRRWARDKMFEVQRLARETVLALQQAALGLEADAARKKVLGHALRADSAKGIDGMVKVVRYLSGVTVSAGTLDRDNDVLNVANGILDLRSFELRPHDPKAMLTRLVDVPYDPEAKAPLRQAFLRDVFRENDRVIEFVQRCVGYTLTGGIDEQVVLCHLSVSTLRKRLKDPIHPLPCHRQGGKILVRRSDFDSWMAAYRRVGDQDVAAVVDDVLASLA